MDQNLKLKQTIDALFGTGVSRLLPKDFELKISRKTGKIRSVHDKEKLLLTSRTDGGLALTLHCAKLFVKSKSFRNLASKICLENLFYGKREKK